MRQSRYKRLGDARAHLRPPGRFLMSFCSIWRCSNGKPQHSKGPLPYSGKFLPLFLLLRLSLGSLGFSTISALIHRAYSCSSCFYDSCISCFLISRDGEVHHFVREVHSGEPGGPKMRLFRWRPYTLNLPTRSRRMFGIPRRGLRPLDGLLSHFYAQQHAF